MTDFSLIVWIILGAAVSLLALYVVVRLAIVHALRQVRRPPVEVDDWRTRPTS